MELTVFITVVLLLGAGIAIYLFELSKKKNAKPVSKVVKKPIKETKTKKRGRKPKAKK